MGRPAKYTCPDTMEDRINEYFAKCDENKDPYTAPGLSNALGFMDRQSLLDYKGKPEFSCVIKRAVQRMEDHIIKRMLKPGQPTAGLIFVSKNWFDYRDAKDLSVSHSYDKEADQISFASRVAKKDEENQEVMH